MPIVGRVAAGAPLLAEQNIEGALALDDSVARWDGCFLLRVWLKLQNLPRHAPARFYDIVVQVAFIRPAPSPASG